MRNIGSEMVWKKPNKYNYEIHLCPKGESGVSPVHSNQFVDIPGLGKVHVFNEWLGMQRAICKTKHYIPKTSKSNIVIKPTALLVKKVKQKRRLLPKPFEPRHDKTNKLSVRPAKTQISLGIRPVWSESSLSAWRKLGSLATHWAHSECSDQSGRRPRLIWVFAGRTVTLLVLSCCGSFYSPTQSIECTNLIEICRKPQIWPLLRYAYQTSGSFEGPCLWALGATIFHRISHQCYWSVCSLPG